MHSVKTHRNASRGFTLLELLIVISIIAILSALGYTIYAAAVAQAKRVKCALEVQGIVEAANQYFRELGVYPPDTGNYEPDDQPPSGLSASTVQFAIHRYLGMELTDKKSGLTYGPYLRNLAIGKNLKEDSETEVDGIKVMLYTDPWGEPYELDCTHWIRDPQTRNVTTSKPYQASTPLELQTLDIRAWSKGPDKASSETAQFYEPPDVKDPKDDDNIMSWYGKGR